MVESVAATPLTARQLVGGMWPGPACGNVTRSRTTSGSLRVPDDLPKVAVQVAEVAGVDAPRPLARRGDGCPGGLGLLDQLIHLGGALHELAQAELARARWADRNRCVLGEVSARVEAEEQPTLEREHRDGAVRAGFLVRPLRPDDAARLEA